MSVSSAAPSREIWTGCRKDSYTSSFTKRHKDRHELIGKGYIGTDAILNIINHPKLRHLPFYLETPNDLAGYAAEIKFLKDHYLEK